MVSQRFMTDLVTVWTESQDGDGDQFNGGGSTWVRKVAKCTFASGGEIQTDSNGAEFKPRSTFYVAEEFARGVRVMLGNNPSQKPPANAEMVRKVDTWTPLRNQRQDWVLYTG